LIIGIGTKHGSFSLQFINIWHHICFLWWHCDRSLTASWRTTLKDRRRSMFMTWGRVHNVDTRRRLRTWRDATSKSSIEGRSRSNFMNIMKSRWALRPQKNVNDIIINCILDVVKWRQKSIKSTLKGPPRLPYIYSCIAWNKKRKVAHWLSVFNIVIFYFDKLWYDSLNSPIKNIEYFWKDCVSYQWVC
jgi:hypothetical protein